MIHLHVHSHYSLRDSIVKIPELVQKIKEERINSCAITDHGNVAGWVEFYNECIANNIKPILGCEFYFVDKLNPKERFHIVLIAKNNNGIQNIIRLNNIAYRDNFYYYPLIYEENLLKYSEGIIILTACIRSIINISSDIILKLRDHFEVYCEIMLHEMKEQKQHNLRILEVANKYNLPLVLSQDVHYLVKEDYKTHCLVKDMEGVSRYEGNTFYFTTMKDLSNMSIEHQYIDKVDLLLAIKNTYKIASMIDISLEPKSNYI